MFFKRGEIPIYFEIIKVCNSDIGIRVFVQVFNKSNILEFPIKELKNYLLDDKNNIITFNFIIFNFVKTLIDKNTVSKYMLKKYMPKFDTYIDKCAENLRTEIFKMINNL